MSNKIMVKLNRRVMDDNLGQIMGEKISLQNFEWESKEKNILTGYAPDLQNIYNLIENYKKSNGLYQVKFDLIPNYKTALVIKYTFYITNSKNNDFKPETVIPENILIRHTRPYRDGHLVTVFNHINAEKLFFSQGITSFSIYINNLVPPDYTVHRFYYDLVKSKKFVRTPHLIKISGIPSLAQLEKVYFQQLLKNLCARVLFADETSHIISFTSYYDYMRILRLKISMGDFRFCSSPKVILDIEPLYIEYSEDIESHLVETDSLIPAKTCSQDEITKKPIKFDTHLDSLDYAFLNQPIICIAPKHVFITYSIAKEININRIISPVVLVTNISNDISIDQLLSDFLDSSINSIQKICNWGETNYILYPSLFEQYVKWAGNKKYKINLNLLDEHQFPSLYQLKITPSELNYLEKLKMKLIELFNPLSLIINNNDTPIIMEHWNF
ncbi:hypothetical protein MXB_5051 [Myxobolus squamalis]|nr:hypothetical protein MXB_5051 [Myxobolus squamalis]